MKKATSMIFIKERYQIENRKYYEQLYRHKFEKLAEMDQFFDKHKSEPLAVAAVPLLFEIKIEKMFDKILLISADENIRLERLMKRNNITKKFAQKMISAQISEREKKFQHSMSRISFYRTKLK